MYDDMTMISALRMLSVDAVQAANSGHPGLPLGAAPMAFALWKDRLQISPNHPEWPDRDRFILSAGHGSALLYALLHVHGFAVTADDLRNFRQTGSRTPGHPEYGDTEGVEATTGPLGQGLAMGVGMALAEAHLAARFSVDGESLFDHYTFALASDGDMMEGVTNEASSLAGALCLNKLIVLYDSNEISIEGDTAIAFTESVRGRYEALGWHTLLVEDGNNLDDLREAIDEAKQAERPTLIEVRTQIGFGSPRVGTAKAHGEALGEENVTLTREAFSWEHEPFVLPDEAGAYRKAYTERGDVLYRAWEEKKERLFAAHPEMAARYDAYFGQEGPAKVELSFAKDMATRASSSVVLNAIADKRENLIGGSADLAPSNKSLMEQRDSFTREHRAGSNLHFGIREFAMAAMANGMALHGGLRPYCATFLVFSDYMKPAIRLAALMGLPVVYIFTHDSIGVGEDGPTHQPIEHLTMLRSIPNMTVFRPADGKETLAAWDYAMDHTNGPTALALTRQTVPELEGTGADAKRGAYILHDPKEAQMILLATGSEVQLALEAADRLAKEDIFCRVVSMPSWEVFEKQDAAYKEKVLPKAVRNRIAIEAAGVFGWERYTGLDGEIIGMRSFGASGPGEEIYEKFGITTEAVCQAARKRMNKE